MATTRAPYSTEARTTARVRHFEHLFTMLRTLACVQSAQKAKTDMETFRDARERGVSICCAATCSEDCVLGTDHPHCFYYAE